MMLAGRLAVWSFLLAAALASSSARGVAQLQLNEQSSARTGKILGELSTAEGMIEKELRGHPKIVQEEMHFLHQAEDAARHHTEADTIKAGLIQQRGMQQATSLMGGTLSRLNSVENMVKKALSQHPQELKLEEQALHQAESAAKAVDSPQAGALVQKSKAQTESFQELKASTEELEQQRIASMANSLQEERSYGKAEHQLSEDGDKILSQFGNVEDSIAQAFAGKDSKAVKTAMKVGELLEKARDKQQQVTKLNAAEAVDADKEANVLGAALAQTTAEGRATQEQRAYSTAMSSLVKDEKAAVSEFSSIKSAVAQAFAGQDGKAVEKAMQVGELLDQARVDQKQIAEKDARSAADASKLFEDLSEHVLHHSRKKAFLQNQGQLSTGSFSAHALRLQSLAAKQGGILHLTEHAEDAITRELAKNGSPAAMATEHEVISMLEQAKHAEEAAYNAETHAAHSAKSSQ